MCDHAFLVTLVYVHTNMYADVCKLGYKLLPFVILYIWDEIILNKHLFVVLLSIMNAVNIIVNYTGDSFILPSYPKV